MLIKSLQNNNQICINISQERHSLRASALNPLNSLIWLVRNDFPDPTILNMFHVSLEVSRINGFAAVQEYFNAYLPAEEGCWFISQLFDLKQACKATVGLSWSAAELAKDKRNPCTDGCYLGSWSHGLYLLPRFHPGLVKFDFISVLIDRPRQDKSENSKWGERTIEVGEKFDAVFSTSQIFRERHDLFSGDLEERPLSNFLPNLGIGTTISLSASRESQLLSGTRQIDHTQ